MLPNFINNLITSAVGFIIITSNNNKIIFNITSKTHGDYRRH